MYMTLLALSVPFFALLSVFVPPHQFCVFLVLLKFAQRTLLTAPAQVTDNQTDTTNEITTEQHLGRSLHAEL